MGKLLCAVANQSLTGLNALSLVPTSYGSDRPLDIFAAALDRFLVSGYYPLDLYKPKRSYNLYFSASTATTTLTLPFYKSVTAQSGYDNADFLADMAYVSDVYKVYDLTADPTKGTNLYSSDSFAIGEKSLTLTTASDGTARDWAVECAGVPYQGIGADIYANNTAPGYSASGATTRFRVIHVPDMAYATSDGYAQSGVYWDHSPLIARLPLNNAGITASSQDADAYTGVSLKVNYSNERGTQGLVQVPRTGVESGYVQPQRTTFSLGGTAAYRGCTTTENVRTAIQYVGGAGYPAVVFLPMLVKAERIYANSSHDSLVRTGELLLAVVTNNVGVAATDPPAYLPAYGNTGAVDLFRLPERPILAGEVKVI